MNRIAAGDYRGGVAAASFRTIGTTLWRKSTYSNPSGNCVELASAADGSVHIRDSHRPAGARLSYSAATFGAFVTSTKRGRFDRPPR